MANHITDLPLNAVIEYRLMPHPIDHLKRAGAAIRETRSNDCFTQAKALEAAIRSETCWHCSAGAIGEVKAAAGCCDVRFTPKADIGGAEGHVR